MSTALDNPVEAKLPTNSKPNSIEPIRLLRCAGGIGGPLPVEQSPFNGRNSNARIRKGDLRAIATSL